MRGFLALLVFFAWCVSQAFAVDLGPLTAAEQSGPSLRTELDQLQADIQRDGMTAQQLSAKRAAIDRVRSEAARLLAAIEPPLKEVSEQLAKLGAPPEYGSEAPEIVKNRVELESQKARHVAARTMLDLLVTTADQALSKASARLRDLFFSRVFDQGRSILLPALWTEGFAAFSVLASRLSGIVTAWFSEAAAKNASGHLAAFFFAMAAMLAIIFLLQSWFSRLFERRRASRQHSAIDRLFRVIRRPASWLLLLMAGFLFLLAFGEGLGVLNKRATAIVEVAFSVFATVSIYTSFLFAILAPRHPHLRLAPLEDGQAKWLAKLALALAIVLGFRDTVDELGETILLPLAITEMRGAIAALALIAIITLALRTLKPPLIQQQYAQMENRRYFAWLKYARLPAIAVVVVASLALLLGYVALADFVTVQFVETLLLLTLLYLLHRLVDEFIGSQLGPDRAAGRFLRSALYVQERGISRLKMLLRTTADILAFLVGLPILFVQWTVNWIDLPNLISSLLTGIRVGDLTISPVAILSAFAVLVLGVFGANLFTRWLDRRVLSETHFDQGVKDSLRKGAGYTGITLAAGFALAAAGIDFSSLAIIFGALGVGIGFGLNSIVTNFVSGLILLAERPVKVGDWVITSAGEGLVRRVNVRSTLIETFDKCMIIVPNSQLITEAVRNWTHDSAQGRFMVALTTDFDSDPKLVSGLMIEAAKAHPKVLKSPPPAVIFAGFGQMGQNFEMRSHVANIHDHAMVASDIRMAIDAALKAHNIRIPVVQPPLPEAPKKGRK